MIRVKICGITTPEGAVAAADAGADAVGINLLAGPRQVTVEVACSILRAVPPLCTPVALLDVSTGGVPSEYLELLGRYWVSHVQVYGAVTPDIIARLRSDGFVPLLVQHVIPGRFPADIVETLSAMSACPPAGIVLDAHQPGKLGGTGTPADWELIKRARDAGQMQSWPPIMLAGGLHPENVAEAIRTVEPWAIDVSSGVEATVGRKDPKKMRQFVEQARGNLQ